MNTTSSINALQVTAEQELQELANKTDALLSELAHVQKQTSIVKRRLDVYASSVTSINRLSQENLQYIFQFAGMDHTDYYRNPRRHRIYAAPHPFALTAVSKSWNTATKKAPHIWNYLQLDLKAAGHGESPFSFEMSDALYALNIFKARVDSNRLSLHVTFPNSWIYDPDETHNFFKLLSTSRLKSLDLYTHESQLAWIKSNHFRNLQQLLLNCWDVSDSTTHQSFRLKPHMPLLQRAAFKLADIQSIHGLALSNITSLLLITSYSVTELINILNGCPQLTRLVIKCNDDIVDEPPQVLHVNNLQKFTINLYPSITALLDILVAPKLFYMKFIGDHECSDISSGYTFLARVGQHIDSLEVDAFDVHHLRETTLGHLNNPKVKIHWKCRHHLEAINPVDSGKCWVEYECPAVDEKGELKELCGFEDCLLSDNDIKSLVFE
jgi:hypothetical protein